MALHAIFEIVNFVTALPIAFMHRLLVFDVQKIVCEIESIILYIFKSFGTPAVRVHLETIFLLNARNLLGDNLFLILNLSRILNREIISLHKFSRLLRVLHVEIFWLLRLENPLHLRLHGPIILS